MSKKYEKRIKKAKGKIKKRVVVPKKISDYITNLTIDLKNYSVRAKEAENAIEKLKWYGYQINDNFQMILKILKERHVYHTFGDMEQL